MGSIVASLAPVFKAEGFRKRRHSFNRTQPDGLVHVVDFQMGPYLPPGTEAIPPIRLDLYGQFTVNLGVFLPSLKGRVGRPDPGAWINEADCHMRKRIGELLPEATDTWWSLDDPDRAADAARHALECYGFPWLNRVTSEGEVVELYESGDRLGLPPAARLYVALLHSTHGDRSAAEAVLVDYLAADLAPSHRQFLNELLKREGFEHLAR